MTDYQEYIGALRKCAKEHENDRTSIGQIIVSNLCEVIADLLEDLSSSENSNKSIEEKCPCYYCEHFEIKGWSHCKIHEDAYGDSRCNDYHKINQKPNKSETPTGSTTKDDLGVDCISRADVNRIICEYRDDAAETGSERDLERAYGANAVGTLISKLPSVTPQEPRIITCKDCKYYRNKGNKRSYCTKRLNVDSVTDRYREPNFYCADAVLREVEE